MSHRNFTRCLTLSLKKFIKQKGGAMKCIESHIGKCFIAGLVLLTSSFSHAEVIFQESFDDQPDWTSGMYPSSNSALLPWEGDILPPGWFAGREDKQWAPSSGDSDRHEAVEILANNTGVMTRDGSGKSFVSWRESYDPDGAGRRWNSDGMLLKYFESGYKQLYVEFWINFSNESIQTYYRDGFGMSKIFRIYNWGGNESQFFEYFGDENSPKFLWDFGGATKYGIRNRLSLYARGPNFDPSEIPSLPKDFISGSGGDLDLSYYSNIGGQEADGGTAELPNKKDGGVITGWPVHLDQLMGDERVWTKMAFFVRMNSSPGAADGILAQWIDGQRILYNTNIPWVRSGYSMVPWNIVAIGGNDNFSYYDNAERHEEWYAIDDIKVMTEPPSVLYDADQAPAPIPAPNPPGNILVQ